MCELRTGKTNKCTENVEERDIDYDVLVSDKVYSEMRMISNLRKLKKAKIPIYWDRGSTSAQTATDIKSSHVLSANKL
jgi:hypothetical protein